MIDKGRGNKVRDKAKLKKILNLATKEIRCIFGEKLCEIILFGSYARGDFDQESDIDIIVLVDMPDIELNNYISVVTDATYDLDLKYNVLLSIILKDINQFNRWKNTLPFYMNIVKEGVMLSA